MKRFLRAMTIGLTLFALMLLFDFISTGSVTSSAFKLDLVWGLVTGLGIEFVFPFVLRFFTKGKR